MNSPSGSIHDDVSICLCLGVAWAAWKHASIIPLPRHNALIQNVHPAFDELKKPQAVSTVNT